jgi:ankyrin repeat protein
MTSIELTNNQLTNKLFDAILDKNLSVIKEVINLGADIDSLKVFHGNIKSCPLMVCVNKNYIAGVELLIESGVDVNNMNGGMVKAAMHQKRYDILELLFEAGAKLISSNINMFYGLIYDQRTVEIILHYHDVGQEILDSMDKMKRKQLYDIVKNYIEKKQLKENLEIDLNININKTVKNKL